MTDQSTDVDAVIRTSMEAFAQVLNPATVSPGAAWTFFDFLGDEVVFTHWRFRGRSLVGKETLLKRYFEPLLRAFPQYDFVVEEIIMSPRHLIVRGEFNGIFAADWGQCKAHGKAVSWKAHDIYEFDDSGLICRVWFANDTLRAAREIGWLPDDGVIVGGDPFA